MLPDAPGLFSMMTGWPRILDKGSASVRAATSGVEPPEKPTKMRTGLVGQTAMGLDLSDTFWAKALVEKAHEAIKNVATIKLKRGILRIKAKLFTTQSFDKTVIGTVLTYGSTHHKN